MCCIFYFVSAVLQYHKERSMSISENLTSKKVKDRTKRTRWCLVNHGRPLYHSIFDAVGDHGRSSIGFLPEWLPTSRLVAHTARRWCQLPAGEGATDFFPAV
jgi:hypothetical protein